MRNHHFKNLEKAKKSDKYLSTTELCNVIGCHQVTLLRLQKDGYLEAVAVGTFSLISLLA